MRKVREKEGKCNRSGMLIRIQHPTIYKIAPSTKNYEPKMSRVPRLRNPKLD